MFITLEGPEGSGKTSQLVLLADFLRQRGYPILTTREPGGTQIGDQVRAILSDLRNEEMRPRTELLLFQASRAQLVEQIVLPHLQDGGIVLCDRYADSTLAYQGYGHQTFPLEQVQAIIDFATGGLKPDLTLLLDVDVTIGLARRAQGGEWNRLDAYQLEFHQRVRSGYLQMAQADPQRWLVIDAGRSMEQVQADIQRIVLSALKHRRTE